MQIDLEKVEYIAETTITIRGTRRRTTVPKEVASHFNMSDGDKIRWVLFKDNTLFVVPKLAKTK